MGSYRQYPFTDPEGVQGVVLAASRFVGEEREKLLRLSDGQEILVPRDLLVPENDNSYTLTVPVRSLLQKPAEASVPERVTSGNDAVIPAVEERLVVDRNPVETGRVRIHKQVDSADAVVDEPLLEEDWDIQRVPLNRVLAGEPPESRYEGDTLILPVLEEVLVVEKRLVLREEVHITRRRREVHAPQTHSVRTENVEVERIG